jgi:hypothetical protein
MTSLNLRQQSLAQPGNLADLLQRHVATLPQFAHPSCDLMFGNLIHVSAPKLDPFIREKLVHKNAFY